MVKQLTIALTVSVFLTACGGSDNKKKDSDSLSSSAVSSSVRSVVVSSAASSAVVSSRASSAVVSSAASSAVVSSAASSAVVSSAASSAVVSSAASSAVVSSAASSAVVSSAVSSSKSSVASSSVASSSSSKSSVASSSSSSVASSSSSKSSAASSSSSSVAASVYEYNDFESDNAGVAYSVIGWNGNDPATGTAAVINIAGISGLPANGESVKVVKFAPGNYNAGVRFTFTLAAGKTLADYNIVFDAYFPRTTPADFTGGGSNYYKDFLLIGANPISGPLKEDTAGYLGKFATVNEDVDAWKTYTFTPNATVAAAISGTFELGLGINRPAGSTTDYYLFDNVGLELR